MCSPRHFGVSYTINPWMTDQIGKVDHALANQQWNNLLDALSRHCIVKVLDGEPDVPDLVFTANAGLIHKNIAVLSKFSNQERQPEEPIFKEWFEQNGYTVFQPKNVYEGEGDHLIDHMGRHWMGTGFRSSAAAATEIENVIGVEINCLSLVDPRWYHLDTCFCPLPNGQVMWYPKAFTKESQELIERSFKTQLRVNDYDAGLFCCNCVCIGNDLFMPTGSWVATNLTALKYNVHEFDLSQFMKAGGAAKCLVLKCD